MRVIIDIGMHLELEIPRDQSFHPGERWNRDLGLEFIKQKGRFPEDFVTSEVSRYLGIPGQAISYKVGEREWLSAREESKREARRGFRPEGMAYPRAVARAYGAGADAEGAKIRDTEPVSI